MFEAVFPAAEFHITFDIDNGSWALGTATPHSGYSQSTAKCGVCHAVHRAPTAGTAARPQASATGRQRPSPRRGTRLRVDRSGLHADAPEVLDLQRLPLLPRG